jgi:hypothetical protein
MHMKEIDPETSLVRYLLTTIPLTLLTIWIIVAFQIKYYFGGAEMTSWARIFWPAFVFRGPFSKYNQRRKEAEGYNRV